MTERIAVFIDFQNVHLVGRGLFESGTELHRCVPDPTRVADLIAGKRKPSSCSSTASTASRWRREGLMLMGTPEMPPTEVAGWRAVLIPGDGPDQLRGGRTLRCPATYPQLSSNVRSWDPLLEFLHRRQPDQLPPSAALGG